MPSLNAAAHSGSVAGAATAGGVVKLLGEESSAGSRPGSGSGEPHGLRHRRAWSSVAPAPAALQDDTGSRAGSGSGGAGGGSRGGSGSGGEIVTAGTGAHADLHMVLGGAGRGGKASKKSSNSVGSQPGSRAGSRDGGGAGAGAGASKRSRALRRPGTPQGGSGAPPRKPSADVRITLVEDAQPQARQQQLDRRRSGAQKPLTVPKGAGSQQVGGDPSVVRQVGVCLLCASLASVIPCMRALSCVIT